MMTEGGLAADPDLHSLPTSDIGDLFIGRIINRYSSQCCMLRASCATLLLSSTALLESRGDSAK
jgi:hypothetical protein